MTARVLQPLLVLMAATLAAACSASRAPGSWDGSADGHVGEGLEGLEDHGMLKVRRAGKAQAECSETSVPFPPGACFARSASV